MKTRVLYFVVFKLASFLLSFWLIVAASHVFGAEVNGNQSGRWTLAASPYIVTGNIVVPAGQTLTIEPGVVVKFAGRYSMTIEGTLYAIGSATSLVVLTSVHDKDFGVTAKQSNRPATENDWIGLKFIGKGSSESRLENAMLRYCAQPLVVSQSSPVLQKLIFFECAANFADINGRQVAIQKGMQMDYQTTLPVNTFDVQNVLPSANPNPATAQRENVEAVENEQDFVNPFEQKFEMGEMTMESTFEVHGYADTEFEVDNKNAEGKRSDFDMHHFNIISTFRISDRTLVLGEVEYEHGASLADGSLLGLVALERGWMQITLNEYFNLRIGKFLTPYGIYNQTHDNSPSFIFTKLPFSLYGKHPNPSGNNDRDFAKFLGGVQLNGTIMLLNGDLEYFAYLGNGRGAAPFEKDDNTNKAVGLRTRYANASGNLKVGASYFRERVGSDANTLRELVAGDFEINIKSIRVQSEITYNRFDKLDTNGAISGTLRSALGYYLQGNLTIASIVQPFARFDYYDTDMDIADNAESVITFGLNINVLRNVFFKVEGQHFRGQVADFNAFERFIASIAAGF